MHPSPALGFVAVQLCPLPGLLGRPALRPGGWRLACVSQVSGALPRFPLAGPWAVSVAETEVLTMSSTKASPSPSPGSLPSGVMRPMEVGHSACPRWGAFVPSLAYDTVVTGQACQALKRWSAGTGFNLRSARQVRRSSLASAMPWGTWRRHGCHLGGWAGCGWALAAQLPSRFSASQILVWLNPQACLGCGGAPAWTLGGWS